MTFFEMGTAAPTKQGCLQKGENLLWAQPIGATFYWRGNSQKGEIISGGKLSWGNRKGEKLPAQKRGIGGIEEWGNFFFFLFSIQYYYCYCCENHYEVIAKSEGKEWYLVIRYGKTIICVWKNGFACGKMIS